MGVGAGKPPTVGQAETKTLGVEIKDVSPCFPSSVRKELLSSKFSDLHGFGREFWVPQIR